MALLTPMSELEAVNRMLGSIGQAPVNSLSVSGIGDVDKAKSQLAETNRDVQTTGWSWNTDEAYKLTPDVDGHIAVPLGALDVVPTDKLRTITIRRHPSKGMALYDVDEGRFEFPDDESIECRIIWGFPFDDLPQAARTYIATAAARRFQAQVVSSTVLDRYNEQDEDRAWNLLLRRERASRRTNAFTLNSRLRRFHTRRRF